METTTPFDLNRAIQQWRADLAQSSAFRGENLDELETHLRDSVAAWQARDLSAEEAFYIAAKRVGTGAVLKKEFGKVNTVNVWVERCLWGLIVIQISSAINLVCNPLGSFFNISININSGWLAFAAVISFTVVPILMAAFFVWRLFKSPESKAGRFLEKLSLQPMALAAAAFVLNSGAHMINAYLLNYSNHFAGRAGLVSYVWFLPVGLAYSALIFLLARKRLLRKA
jgi:hypothetical protein